MSSYQARTNRLTNLSPKEFDFRLFVYQTEYNHPSWWGRHRFINWFKSFTDSTKWNCVICLASISAIIIEVTDISSQLPIQMNIIDIIYNVVYAVYVLGNAYNDYRKREFIPMSWSNKFPYAIDIISYLHYPAMLLQEKIFHVVKIVCYYLRLHRPFKYLWTLNDYNLQSSVVDTTLKFTYIFLVMRVTFGIFWLRVDEMGTRQLVVDEQSDLSDTNGTATSTMLELGTDEASRLFSAVYIVNKMFLPIGPIDPPANDLERVACMIIMLTGCLLVTGITIAALSLVISMHMRPEEVYRARFLLIMKDMKNSKVPTELYEKVVTFYRMYWLKQKGVSETELLPTFPPTLPTAVYTDIYFEAQQKSHILRDLSCQFLSEVSKTMETINFIPGDSIIKRGSDKSSIIYITYGDVEMLTAEDDVTPILRMSRGTILSPVGGCAVAACAPAHVGIKAATYCTAHVLRATDLWRVAAKHGKSNSQSFLISASFDEHFERIKKHYATRQIDEMSRYKSSILRFKQSIIALKEATDDEGKPLLECNDVFLEIAGCYVMRNRADATLCDESDDICLRSTFPCILQPTSSLQTAWQACMAFLILLVCITHPYNLVYLKKVSQEFMLFDVVVTCIYVLDIFMHLSTGANLEEGLPITLTQTSSQQMKSFWFALDVLSTVPMLVFVADGEFSGLNKLLKLPKAFYMLKEMENVWVNHSKLLRFISYSFLISFACYLVAVLQHGIMCIGFGYCKVTNYTHSPYWDGLDLGSEETEEDVESLITFSLYWAISMITFTTHKTATWGLDNWFNVIYTMVLMEACIFLFVFVEAVYSATIMVISIMRDEYDSSIENVKNFMIRNRIDPTLRYRFITYLRLCWYTDKAYSMTHKRKSILHDLPVHVYQDLVATQRSQYILCIPFMKFLHKNYLKEISSNTRLFYTSPNEILLNTGDICNEIYVIKQGICELIDPQSKTVVHILSVKKSFGVLECMLRLPTYYTVRAATHVQVLSISIKYLLRAMKIPQIESSIEFAKNQPEYSYLRHRRESFVTYVVPPPSPGREYFKLPRKFERDRAFLDPFYRLGFFSILRYIFPRFTLRPDGKYLTRYEWFRALCAVLSSMVFPCYTYLVLQFPWLYYVATFLDLSAYFDICQRTLVAYFNELGILVFHPASTAAHYLNGAFVVDLLACLPLEYIDAARKDYNGTSLRITTTSQFLMLNRLVQLYRVPGAMNILTVYIERRDILLVIKGIPLLMAMINVMVCFLVYSSAVVYKPLGGGWLISPVDDRNESWLTIFNDKVFRFNMMETPWNLHLAVHFWVVYETTTTGFNVFSPSNISMMQVLIVGKIAATLLTTYFAVRIISIRSNVNKLLAKFQENMKDIAVYMKKENLSNDLQSLLKLCDQITLRSDVILHIYGYTFSKCPILFHCYLALSRILGRAVRNEYFKKDMQIILKDDIIDNLYFVDYGICDVYSDDDLPEIDEKLQRGSVFGNLDADRVSRSPTTVVASSNVHLLQIKTETFYKIITDFPSINVLVKKHRPYGENYIGSTLDKPTESKSWNERIYSSPLISEGPALFELINRNYKFITTYLITISMVCVYCDAYNAGFNNNTLPLIIILYVLDVLFFMKILLCFGLPFSKDGEGKTQFLDSRAAYVKGEFQYDLLSCLPLELLCLFDSQVSWEKFSLLRLNRLFRMVTIHKCLQKRMKLVNINLVLSTIANTFIWFTLFVHCTTCLWYYIGAWEESYIPRSSWFYDTSGKPVCENMYICSLYFILMTFTENGVGDILPRMQLEVIFVSIFEIVSTIMYMIYVGEFSNIIQFQSYRNFDYYSKYLELQEYLNNNRVSKNLVNKVKKYCIHLWRETRGLQIPHFLKKAPPCLRLNIMSAAYMHHLTSNPIFKACEPAFLRQVVGCLQLYIYNEDLYVVKENEITDCLYFIHTGRIQKITEDTPEKFQTLVAGQYFGEGLYRDMRNTHSYQAISNAQVLTLHIDDWEPLLQYFPESKKKIYGGDNGTDDEKGGNEDNNLKVNFPSQDTHGAANAPAPSPTKPPEFARFFGGPSSSLTFNPLEQTSTNLLGHPSDSQSSVKLFPRSSFRKSSIHSDVHKALLPTTNSETEDTQVSVTPSIPKIIYTVTSTTSAASSQLSDLKPKSALNPLLSPKRASLEEKMQMSTTLSLAKLTSVDPAASRQFPDFKSSSTFSLLPRLTRPSTTDETLMSSPPSLLKLTPTGVSTDPSVLAFKAPAPKPLITSQSPTITKGTLMSAPPTSFKLILKTASESPVVPTLRSVMRRPAVNKETQISKPQSLVDSARPSTATSPTNSKKTLTVTDETEMTSSALLTIHTPLAASPQLSELPAHKELSFASISTIKEPVPSQTTLKAQSESTLSIKYVSSLLQKELPARLTTSTNVDTKHVIFDKPDQPFTQPSTSRPRYNIEENVMVEMPDISSLAPKKSSPPKGKFKLFDDTDTDQENTETLSQPVKEISANKKLKTDSGEGSKVDKNLPIKSANEISDLKIMAKSENSELSTKNDSNDVQILIKEPDNADSVNVEKQNETDPFNLNSDVDPAGAELSSVNTD